MEILEAFDLAGTLRGAAQLAGCRRRVKTDPPLRLSHKDVRQGGQHQRRGAVSGVGGRADQAVGAPRGRAMGRRGRGGGA